MTRGIDNNNVYYNAVLTSASGTDEYVLPMFWRQARERWIIVRQCWAGIMNPLNPAVEYPAGNILLHADFVNEADENQYVCLCNSSNSKKKRFKYTFNSDRFKIWFTNPEGYRITPSSYVFDFLLVARM